MNGPRELGAKRLDKSPEGVNLRKGMAKLESLLHSPCFWDNNTKNWFTFLFLACMAFLRIGDFSVEGHFIHITFHSRHDLLWQNVSMYHTHLF